MKGLSIMTSIFALTLSFSVAADAKKRQSSKHMPTAKLGTDFKLDDRMVRGKYQSPTQGLVTVENEKGLNDLLDYRRNYKDRISKSRDLR